MVGKNRLAKEKSIYLLEHAGDPVDWYPWGEEAFDRAKTEDKPILLSIGYATCHWCHVMQKESFRDEGIAGLLNDAFVCIKVDREERPDIDRTYMRVSQIVTGNGGWPLTIIMTPDKKPFFTATYVPKDSRYGMLGMKALADKVKHAWKENRQGLERDADRIVAGLSPEAVEKPHRGGVDYSVMDTAFGQLAGMFDYTHGGFATAPKFHLPSYLLFLMRYWSTNKNSEAQQMAEKTLRTIRAGGVYDQIGYGVHRYSTDMRWFAPHFEKMLYDQVLLAPVYAEMYQITKKREYLNVAEELLTFVIRDLRSKEGGFYTGIDADSEEEEGKFYLWREDEIRNVLHDAEAAIAIEAFGVERNGNYNAGPAEREGTNIPYLAESIADISERFQINQEEVRRNLDSVRKKLFLARERRTHPRVDDKILTDMNGLAISGMARVAKLAEKVSYAQAAEDAAAFILKNLWKDGKLYHRWKDGEASIPAFIDDYAFLIGGILDTYGITFDVSYIKTAIQLTDEMIANFWDKKGGGFYFTAAKSEVVLVRDKELYDGPVPSGNAVAVYNLIRLARMTGMSKYETYANKAIAAFMPALIRQPTAHTSLLVSLAFLLGPSYEIVVAGDRSADDTKEVFRAIRKEFIPNKVVLLKTDELGDVAAYTKRMECADGKATAYICSNYTCDEPVTRVERMLERLGVAYLQ